MSTYLEPVLHERALAALRQRGNPFRQQFARNSDDVVCSRFHVDDLFAKERRVIREVVDTFRGQSTRLTCVLPILGARGAGKTHLLHWLKHGPADFPQLFVTPGTFRIQNKGEDSSFIEYLLYQLINVLLGGGEQRGIRPLLCVGEQLTRRTLVEAIGRLDRSGQLDLMNANFSQRLGWKFGLGVRGCRQQIEEWLSLLGNSQESCKVLARQANFDIERLADVAIEFLHQREPRDLKGELRKRIGSGFVRATLLGEETELADFLTDGFTDVPFQVRPTRVQLTLSLLEALTDVIVGAGIPIAVAFDQLEELLYGQTEDEVRRSSDAFFGGVVQVMSAVPGLCVLLLVEEGLWNRIVPQLSAHILDRIHEPIHLPCHGTIRGMRLSAPTAEQLAAVVSCRIRRTLSDFADVDKLPAGFPFGLEFLHRLAKRESVLRLMLQGCCNRLDEIFDGSENAIADSAGTLSSSVSDTNLAVADDSELEASAPAVIRFETAAATADESGAWNELFERWFQEVRSAERKLAPVGSLAGATAELQGGLALWLRLCMDLGVEQDQWRMAALQDQLKVGEHPTYGSLTVVDWSKTGGLTQRVGIGLWLGRGVGKPRDLEAKLAVFDRNPKEVDHLIFLRPADDARLSGKTESAWEAARGAGHSLRLEAVELEAFAKLYAFPRWMQQVAEQFAQGTVPERVYLFLAEQTETIMARLGLPSETVTQRRAA